MYTTAQNLFTRVWTAIIWWKKKSLGHKSQSAVKHTSGGGDLLVVVTSVNVLVKPRWKNIQQQINIHVTTYLLHKNNYFIFYKRTSLLIMYLYIIILFWYELFTLTNILFLYHDNNIWWEYIFLNIVLRLIL